MELRNEILEAIGRLEQRRRQLENRLDKIDSSILYMPERSGKWSVIQVLTHLSNAEFGALRYIQKKMQGLDSVGMKSFFSSFRSRLLTWMLNSPLKYRMPKQLPEPSNESTFEELKSQFEKNRVAYRELVQTFPEDGLNKLIFKHPFAGRFSLLQTITFLDDHYAHHELQINRILKSVENRGAM